MSNSKIIVDVPLIAKKAREASNSEPLVVEVELPNGEKVDLHVFLFGTKREDLQSGDTNGFCW